METDIPARKSCYLSNSPPSLSKAFGSLGLINFWNSFPAESSMQRDLYAEAKSKHFYLYWSAFSAAASISQGKLPPPEGTASGHSALFVFKQLLNFLCKWGQFYDRHWLFYRRCEFVAGKKGLNDFIRFFLLHLWWWCYRFQFPQHEFVLESAMVVFQVIPQPIVAIFKFFRGFKFCRFDCSVALKA